jgi:predicted nucleotidyltransferase component of viral defense system
VIGERELERRAASLGISLQHAELDYVLNHLLAQFARAPNGLVFRGGAALGRVYWPDFRISEDLDFIWPAAPPEPARLFRNIVASAAEEAAMSLEVVEGRWRDDQIRTVVRWATPWETGGDLLIDVVRYQDAAIPIKLGSLHLPYSDLTAASASIPVLDVLEIMANKWLMLDDRMEPRDLYDLWWALERERIGFEDIARVYRQVYGLPPRRASIERAVRLESGWRQRLDHQMRKPPSFEIVLTAVRDRFDAWHASTGLVEEGPGKER